MGQWVRLWVRKPGNQTIKRRSLLSQAGTPPNSTAATTAAAAPAPNKPTRTVPDSTYEIAGRRLLQQQRRLNQDGPEAAAAPTIPLLLFSDPYLQAAAAAAAVAETAAAEAAYAAGPEPDKADALGTDPAQAEAEEQEALNPLQLEPMLLAAARYGSMALATEIAAGEYDPALLLEQFGAPGNSSTSSSGGDGDGSDGKAPALAVPGSLDYYLYGDNKLVDSGQDYSACTTLLLAAHAASCLLAGCCNPAACRLPSARPLLLLLSALACSESVAADCLHSAPPLLQMCSPAATTSDSPPGAQAACCQGLHTAGRQTLHGIPAQSEALHFHPPTHIFTPATNY